jgi:iron uptake system EfeUOB component EfeO/EfeM
MNDDSIKLMSLLDELEELITSSSKMPFSEKGIIDLDVAQKILEDIRLNLPRDIQQARWLGQEKDRIINEAKREYNRMINEAKDQVEYLVNNNNVYKDAQKRADAVLKEAESHANYMKYRSYEYIDQLLYDMQTDIASVSQQYIEPMTEYFSQMLGNINARVNQNRQEMKTLAERVQLGEDPAAVPEVPEEPVSE